MSDRELSTGSSSSTNTISTDSRISTGYGGTDGLGVYGHPNVAAGAVGRTNPLPSYGGGSAATSGLGVASLSSGFGTTSSSFASRVTPAKTTNSGLPSAHGPPSSFNTYSHHRTYSSPGSSKNHSMGYIIVAVCVFWIVVVLRYVGRD